ncbi:MAG: T9SS type A sorting domain-containing protein [Candidatus Latescibacteria bacterium]|nr:T9SS type A sorting domain-containing protein [Candidatus Latescibacterota bacterium]
MSRYTLIFLIIMGSFLSAHNLVQSEIPISVFTDFSYTSKSPNVFEVKTTITDDIVSEPNFTDIIIDELIESQSHFLYQSKLIAIPDNVNLTLEITRIDSSLILVDNPDLLDALPNQHHESVAYFGEPGIMRDLRVIPLVVRQYRYDHNSQKIIYYHNVELKVKSSLDFPVFTQSGQMSHAWSQLYQSTVLNYQENRLPVYDIGLPQGYLIIVADALYNSVLPLARWKNQKGWTVTITKTSEIGSSVTDFRNYINQAYHTLFPQIEYVLLVGTVNLIPAAAVYAIGDHIYSCVEGNDLYPDLFVGRLPAANTSELGVMVAKILGYEQNPYMDTTNWFRRGLVVATSYQASGNPVWTALLTSRWVRSLLLKHNYQRVDTVFDPPNSSGVGIIDTIINSGVTYVCGRGWGNREGWDRPYFKTPNVYNLTNGWKLPVITSFYCATGNYNAYPTRSFGEAWLLAGTPTVPKGGIAFYGPTYPLTSTRYNNCHAYFVYWAIFEENIYNCGPAMFKGKIGMLNNFPIPSDSEQVRIHVVSYNLLGDPSLAMWGGQVPQQFQVSYPTQLSVGSSQLTVSVQNSSAQPIAGALVSLVKTNEVKVVGYTDESGVAAFNFTTGSQDTLFVTVTKRNFIPHRGQVQIISNPVYVGYYSHTGNIVAGQSDNLTVSLKNYGISQIANNTNATLRANDPYIVITDSVKSYGDIAPGQILAGSPYQFTVAPNCTNNHKIDFQLAINSATNNWQAGFNCSVRAAELTYKSHTINDGNNGILDPGETANLIVKIYNRGAENIANVSAVLRSANPYAIQVVDSTGYYGTLNIGETLQNTADYFTLHASPAIGLGRKFYLQLVLRSINYERIVEFPIIIGNVSANAPLGPDSYGYWAYDNTDIGYTECPTYAWVEIDPNFGGSGTQIPMPNNSIRTVYLPFTFKYYGQNYNRISVASNGYLAMDSSWVIDMYNWSIPSPMGPAALIAPFWDYFHPDTLSSSGIFYYYDAANHRYIVQWSRLHHMHGFRNPYPAEQQTFQAILHNPQFYPTLTGDGPIVFQYHTVFNDDSASVDCHNYATVGIESPCQSIGIQYTFANQYPPAAAIIDHGRAIKFTTNPPDTFTGIFNPIENRYIPTAQFSAYPNPIKNQTYLNYSLSFSSRVSLNIYDVNGKMIERLLPQQEQMPGNYRLVWQRNRLPSGVYFAILTIDENSKVLNKKVKIIIN